MRELMDHEIESVDGGLANFAFGAIVGGITYGASSLITGSFSWSGLTGSVVAGAITSGFSAVAGGGRLATAYFGGIGSLSGGATYNALERSS